MRPLGILLFVIGVAVAGLGIAGRIRAARLLGPRSGNPIYDAKRLYELPDHGLGVRSLIKSGNRLIVSGASLCLVGILSIL
jgi:hypothetical protein